MHHLLDAFDDVPVGDRSLDLDMGPPGHYPSFNMGLSETIIAYDIFNAYGLFIPVALFDDNFLF